MNGNGGYSKSLYFQGSLYAIIGFCTPVIAILTSDTPLTSKTWIILFLTGISGSAVAVKGFLSDTFANEKKKADDAVALQSGQRWP